MPGVECGADSPPAPAATAARINAAVGIPRHPDMTVECCPCGKEKATRGWVSPPKFSYRAHDLEVVDSISAAEILGLRFDRAFYKLMAFNLAFECLGADAKYDTTAFEGAVAATESEICALLAGTEIFAERIGLDLSQVLAFSTVLDADFYGLGWPLGTLSENDMRQANEVADVFQEVWAKWGNSIEGFGKAS